MTASLAADLTQVADGVYVREMLTIEKAIDAFLSDGRARGWPERTTIRTYARTLYGLADRFPPGTDVAKITSDDIRAFRAMRQRRRLKEATISNDEAAIASFTKFLLENGKIKRDPMAPVRRTRRPRPENVEVVSVNSAQVLQLLDEARPGRELNTVAIAAYLGARRTAIARVRFEDYTGERILLHEKGKKAIWKLVPAELALILDASIERGDIWAAPDDYLVPPLQPITARERDATVIWRIIKTVAGRAGVETHVHALRAAFACFYLENNPNDLVGLSEALGHTSLAMTMVYLRRLERDTRMLPLRSLSWQSARAVTEGERPSPDTEASSREEAPLTSPSATAQPSDSTATSLSGQPVPVPVAAETRLPGDPVVERPTRQISSDSLVDDLLGRLLSGETAEEIA